MWRESVTGQAIREKRESTEPAAFEPRSNALERLHALVRKGYKAEIGSDEDTSIVVLRHLGKAPDLVLRADGAIQPWEGRRPWHKRHLPNLPTIASDTQADQLEFMTFLDTVPRATLRDRTRPWRNKYLYFPIVLVVIWGLCLGLTTMFFEL